AYYRSIGPLFTYNALFVPVFFMAGLLCMVMSALFRQAAELIDSGKALKTLEAVIAASQA
ncbi:hypothetical protein, partial [Faecalibaculum rodentium]|uniref:hypothetical protein n=1 Tax=Faecalibaculum rodentium TaxID=1702221 RepID=UPI0025AD41D3